MAQALGIERPYLMVDVEPRMVKRSEECLNLRSALAEVAKAEWARDTKGGPAETAPLPPLMDGLNCRATLRLAQEESPAMKVVILQKRAEFGPARASFKPLANPLKPVELATYRLSPLDDVLEKRLVLAEGALWVPVIPDSAMHIGNVSW